MGLEQMIGQAVDLGPLKRRVQGLEDRVEALEGAAAPDAIAAPDNTTINQSGVVEPEEQVEPLEPEQKGDLLSADATPAPGLLPVGEDGQVLTADSGESLGLAWEDLPEGEGGGSGDYFLLGEGRSFGLPISLPKGTTGLLLYILADGINGETQLLSSISFGGKAPTLQFQAINGEEWGPALACYRLAPVPTDQQLLLLEFAAGFAAVRKQVAIISIQSTGPIAEVREGSSSFYEGTKDSKTESGLPKVKSGQTGLLKIGAVARLTTTLPVKREIWQSAPEEAIHAAELLRQLIWENTTSERIGIFELSADSEPNGTQGVSAPRLRTTWEAASGEAGRSGHSYPGLTIVE